MAKDVIMPVLGMNQDTAVLIGWLKQEGERVEQGEPIMEVETDKATMELDAPASGTLSGVRAAAGDEVEVGSVVAVILADGEEATTTGRPASPAAGTGDAPARGASEAGPDGSHPEAGAPGGRDAPGTAAERVPRPPVAAAANGAAVPGPDDGRIVPASPKARRLAAERGLPLAPLRGRGSGPEGALLAADVLRAAQAAPPIAAAQPAAGAVPVAPPRFERVIDAGRLLATATWARGRLRAVAKGAEPDLGDLMARFLLAVWSRQPLSERGGDAILRYRRIVDGELGTVALRVGDATDVAEIVRARAAEDAPAEDAAAPADLDLLDLSRCRADLMPDGASPGAAAVTVIVGRLEEQVLAVDGTPSVAPALRLSLVFDPARVGLAEAAAWCDRVIALAEEPSALTLLY